MLKSRGVPPLGIAALLVWAAGLPGEAAAASASLESATPIQVATLRVPGGTIYVNLTDDVAAGDTASATVNPVPEGKTARDQAKQLEELQGYAVELGGQRAPASERIRTFTVPAGAKAMVIALLDRRGRRVADVKVPLIPAAPLPSGYAFPALGQGGAALAATGAFDGDLSNSEVQMGGTRAQPVAESPRKLVVRAPAEGAPPAPVEVKERGVVVTSGSYRNVGVQLAAGATSLLAGQRTTLAITVSGLEGLRQKLPLRLFSQSPSVVTMEGGNEQTLCVDPDDVKANGTWTTTRELTGVRPGAFAIGTEVSQPPPHAESWAAAGFRLEGELRARLLLEQPARAASGEALESGPYAVLVRGSDEAGTLQLSLGRQGAPAGTLAGRLLERMSSATPCDRGDVAAAALGMLGGSPGFTDLGFEHDRLFAVRDDNDRRWLFLATPEEVFAIEADLAPPQP